MKVKILEAAFYNNVYYKKGAIVEINIKKCPSWAEVIEVKQQKTPKQNQNNEKNNPDNNEAKKREEYLEELLNKAFDKGILLEDTENKTVDEQIKELEELLKG